MKEIYRLVILVMTTSLLRATEVVNSKHVRKREAGGGLNLDEFLRPPPYKQSGRSFNKYSDADIIIVNPPKIVEERLSNRREDSRPRITMIPTKPLHGYLKLKAVGSDWVGLNDANEGVETNYRNVYQKTTPYRSQERIINLTTPRPRDVSLGQRLARWFFSADDEDEDHHQQSGSAPRPNHIRPPPNYEKFPPFWQDQKRQQQHQQQHQQQYPVPQQYNNYQQQQIRPQQPYQQQQQQQSQYHYNQQQQQHQQQQQYHNQHNQHQKNQQSNKLKKECNPCNSVPWVPMSKTPAGISESVISLINPPSHDSSAHYSAASLSVVPPAAPVVENSPGATIPTSFGLPAGNLPTSHGLLPPIPAVVTHLQPVTSYQPIPFPELSHVPLAPVYDPKQFQDETRDLVPPLPPKSIGNVIFTISEQPTHHQEVHNSLHHDQVPESSIIDAQPSGTTEHNVEIIKSVPLAAYTSSIEYPLQIVQSGPIIDIHTNASKKPYEKESQTGEQKISDLLFGSEKKKDSDAESSVIEVATDRIEVTKQGKSDPIFTTQQYHDKYRTESTKLIDSSILTPPPVPPNFNQFSTVQVPDFAGVPQTYLHPPDKPPPYLQPWISTPVPFLIDSSIASIINGGLLPPPAPSQTPLEHKPKKIQIIIPYTTIDQNALSSMQQTSFLPDITVNLTTSKLPSIQTSHTWMQMAMTEESPTPRKVPYQTFDNFKNVNTTETNQVNNRTDLKHILATNLRELLKVEVEPKGQNIRLQKNIDDWTALEYSNHKTTTQKLPVEVVSKAQTVTSLPGTSVSHLLLPSKKIPDTYLTTTPIPRYDEPTTQPYTNSFSVNSRPFTANTESVYKVNSLNLESIKQRSQKERMTQLSSYANQQNHKNGYTNVQKTKPNAWSKLSENLIIPEERMSSQETKTTTVKTKWEDLDVSISPITNEKVYVVTPVSRIKPTDDSWTIEKTRTTRHISTTEKYNSLEKEIVVPVTPTTKTRKQSTERNILVDRSKSIEATKNSTKLMPSKNSRPFKQDIVTPKTPILTLKPKLQETPRNKTDSTPLFRIKTNKTVSKFNKPKPIDKFFPTTTRTLVSTSTPTTSKPVQDKLVLPDGVASLSDIFPFRNGGELPVEMARITQTFSDLATQLGDMLPERKSLIKQMNINNKRLTVAKSGTKTTMITTTSKPQSTEEITNHDGSTPTTERSSILNNQHITKRSTNPPSSTTNDAETSQVTRDERRETNNLSNNDTSDLLAVETSRSRKMPADKNSKMSTDFLEETIKLLKEFLKDSEVQSKNKTDINQKLIVNENFTEHDKLLDGLEKLKPMLDLKKKVSKNEKKEDSKPKDVKENLKTIETKLMKSLKNDKNKKGYILNFPEFINSDFDLNSEESDLLEGAIYELKKNKKVKN